MTMCYSYSTLFDATDSQKMLWVLSNKCFMFQPTCNDAQPDPDVVGDGDVVLVHAGLTLLAQLTGHI